MDEWEKLRAELIRFVKKKFYSRPQIGEVADDIVNEAIADVIKDPDKCNFGYLSKACIHTAYRLFQRLDADSRALLEYGGQIGFLDEGDVVEEILQNQDTAEILASLDALKQIERVIIMQRYYGDYSFVQIAKENNIKLNTVLSHHRRALEKLRPRLSMFAAGREKRRAGERQKRAKHFTTLF